MITLLTMADFLRESGGTYNRQHDKVRMTFAQFKKYTMSIIGQTIIDSANGEHIKTIHERNKQLESAAKLALTIAEAHIADIQNDETRALMMAELDSVRELVGGGE